jgi:hypothetical protein
MALRPVYSIQIMALSPCLPVNTVVVPDGSRIIVRDLDVTERTGATGEQLAFENAATGFIWLLSSTPGVGVNSFAWRGRQVFNPGESITVRVISGTWDAQMSGYELSLT